MTLSGSDPPARRRPAMTHNILSPKGALAITVLSAALGLTLSSCAGPAPDDLSKKNFHEDPTQDPGQAPGLYVGGEDNTFSHQSDLGGEGARDPFDILAQRLEEGPPE